MVGNFNSDPMFRDEMDTSGELPGQMPDEQTPPLTSSDESIDYWKGMPDPTPEERLHLVRHIGAQPIREIIEQSVHRHPAAHQPTAHRF